MTSLLEAKTVHLIGIGGISMSAIAHILLERGLTVTGSDAKSSYAVDTLRAAGARVTIGHSASNIAHQDLLIYTGAIDDSNPEFQSAVALNIPILRRTEAINQLMSDYPVSLAFSGTHGKTSSTTMATMILEAAMTDPSYLVGARLPHSHKAYHMAPSEFITIEACEYKAGFLDLFPTTLVVNNIEEEHLDFYKNLDAIVETFQEFTTHLTAEHHLILNNDDFNVRKLNRHQNAPILTYGINVPSNYEARALTFNHEGQPTFELFVNGESQTKITLSVPGRHNVYNALGAIAATHANGIDFESIKKALEAFTNAERRFEVLGNFHGATIVSDYAHHPSEVKATLHAAQNLEGQDIIAVFQPHTYSRTKTLLHETAGAFKGCKHVFITDIYAARETNTYNIHSRDLVNCILEEQDNVTYLASLDDIADAIKPLCHENTFVVLMGAGDIDGAARKLVAPTK